MFHLPKHAKRADGESGFTLIELLVVVVIIGILVAIAIPLYLNYKKSAADKSAMSDLRGAISTLELCQASDGTYPIEEFELPDRTENVCTTQTITTSSGTILWYYPSTLKAVETPILRPAPDAGMRTEVFRGDDTGGDVTLGDPDEVRAETATPVPVPARGAGQPTAYTLVAWNTNGASSADRPYCYTSTLAGRIKHRNEPLREFGAC